MQFTIGQARYGHGIAAASEWSDVVPAAAANDNDQALIRNGLLRAALRHFAEHGLGAAELAQRNAEQAFFAGNRKEYRHWLDICRALDQRMGDALAFRQGPRLAGAIGAFGNRPINHSVTPDL